jgi:hypothetical protein
MKNSLIPLICVFGALPVLACGCGSESGDTKGVSPAITFSPSNDTGTAEAPTKNDPTFENGVLTTSDLKIRITRFKVIKSGRKGNEYGKKPVIAFWYKTENLSGAKVDPMVAFIVGFKAYQDNNPNAENELDVGSLPDTRFLDSQSERIKKGGTVENAVAYELDDLVTPVNLVAIEGLDEVVGKATYKLR